MGIKIEEPETPPPPTFVLSSALPPIPALPQIPRSSQVNKKKAEPTTRPTISKISVSILPDAASIFIQWTANRHIRKSLGKPRLAKNTQS